MKAISLTFFVLLFLVFSSLGLQAQSPQFEDIFQPHLGKTFRGLALGMDFSEVNNVTNIPRDQLYGNPNVPFSYPINRYGKEGDKMEGFLLFSQDETLNEIIVRITLIDALNYSDIKTEIVEYLDYEYGSVSRWGLESRWQMGALRVVLQMEESGSGGMLILKFRHSNS